MTKNRGLFITVEGVEGVGKSTNIETIKNFLAEKNVEFVLTREPGGTLIAEQIREILLKPHEEKLTELSELLLVFAARAQHVATVIKPALVSGRWVICDRFTDATMAYQGAGRGLSVAVIQQLRQLVQAELQPDLTLLLDAPIEVGMGRASRRGELDRFEREQADFFQRVRQGYLDQAHAEPERYRVIDASQALEAVQQDIHQVLQEVLQGAGA